MTPERQAEFLALISKGESIGGACRRLKISSSRVNTFRNAHRDFDAQVRQAFADSAVKRQEIFRQRSTAWRPRSGVPSRPVEGKKVPAIVEPFLAELAHGASVTAAAEYAGVSRAMIFRWRRDDPEFARRIAHEIKNPLNFVNNFSGVSVELINELEETLGRVTADDKIRAEITELADTLRDNLDKILQHGKRADSIVKNMLLHSRQGSGERRLVDVNALVEESLNLAYHGARAEKQGFNVTLQRSFDPSAGEVDAFPQEISRDLLNLISNGFYAATANDIPDSRACCFAHAWGVKRKYCAHFEFFACCKTDMSSVGFGFRLRCLPHDQRRGDWAVRLIGNFLSPYVRRVAVSLHLLELPFELEELFVFKEPDVVRRYNPLVRIPVLVLDDGANLVESGAILDEIDHMVSPKQRLIPSDGLERRRVVQTAALALACAEKAQWALYEGRFRPAEKVHTPWIEHNEKQVLSGFDHLNAAASEVGDGGWIAGTPAISQADVTTTVAYTFAKIVRPTLELAERFPALSHFAARCEILPAFVKAPVPAAT